MGWFHRLVHDCCVCLCAMWWLVHITYAFLCLFASGAPCVLHAPYPTKWSHFTKHVNIWRTCEPVLELCNKYATHYANHISKCGWFVSIWFLKLLQLSSTNESIAYSLLHYMYFECMHIWGVFCEPILFCVDIAGYPWRLLCCNVRPPPKRIPWN